MGKISDALKGAMGGGMMDEEPDALDPMEDTEDEGEGSDEAAQLLATKQVLKAVKSGNASALKDALKSFMDACGGY